MGWFGEELKKIANDTMVLIWVHNETYNYNTAMKQDNYSKQN